MATPPPPPIEGPLGTVDEVARFIHVSERTVRRRIADGSLEVIRIGRAIRIAPKALQALLKAGKQPKRKPRKNYRE